jgi:hypothetical protein
MVDDPTLTLPPVSSGGPDAGDGTTAVELEAFSAAHATASLDRDLAAVRSQADARPILTRHAHALVPQIEMVIRRHRKALQTIELTKRHKVANCWRSCALALINECEGGGGALPVFAGHSDFVSSLRSHLEQADSLAAFTALLGEEESRWKRSLFGRNKVRILHEIKERMGAQLDKLVKDTQTKVETTLAPRVEQQHKSYELEVGSLGDWYRHLLGAPLRAAGAAGIPLRWEIVAAWETDLLTRITQVRSDDAACLELGRVWNHVDQELGASFKEHMRRVRLDGQASDAAQRDLVQRELAALTAHLDAIGRHRRSLEAMSEAVQKTLERAITTINALPQSQLRQFVELTRHSSVRSVSDLFDAIKAANHLSTDGRKVVFETLAALEPFRAVRFKQRRAQTQVDAHREAFARYLPAASG